MSAPSLGEVADLLRDYRRLMDLGSSASDWDWLAWQERKVVLLERIAADPGPLNDEVQVLAIARDARGRLSAAREGEG